MRTAVDSNIFSAIWSGEARGPQLLQLLAASRAQGVIVISPPVFAELHAHPRLGADEIQDFLNVTGVVVDFHLSEQVWREAGQRFARYAVRRRKATGSEPRGLLSDFVIGAHALLQADCLMTLDKRIYHQDFAELNLL